MSKKISNKQAGMPKSKAARQKLRRWTFTAEMKADDGTKFGLHMPGVVFGNSAEANALAKELQRAYREQHGEAADGITVAPIGHETVSMATKRQLEGLSDNANLAFKAAYLLAEKLKLAAGLEKDEHAIVQEAVEDARKILFKRLQKAQDTVAALEGEVLAPEAYVPHPEEVKPKRKLGIDAVNEILNSPVEA